MSANNQVPRGLSNMSTQERLEEILDRLAVRMYDEGQLDKPSLMGRQVAITNINEAKAQILALIDSAKREELERLLKWSEEWTKAHDEPFNWVGAIKSMSIGK